MTDRTAARVVGTLFILATGSFSASVYVLDPVIGASDFLTQVALGEARVGIGVLLELVNHTAVVGIAVVMYPILKRYGERLAMGYVAARSIEAILFAVATMHLLTLVPVSQEFVAAGAPSGSHLQSMGDVLLAGHDWNRTPLAFTAFGVGCPDTQRCSLLDSDRAAVDFRLRSARRFVDSRGSASAARRRRAFLERGDDAGRLDLPAGDGVRRVADSQGLRSLCHGDAF